MKKCLLLSLLFLTSCSELVGPPGSPSAVEAFRALWSEYDRRYPYFDLTPVNWDSMYTALAPNIHDGMPPEQLASYMDTLLMPLQDGHGGVSPQPYFSFTFHVRKQYDSLMFVDRALIAGKYLRNTAAITPSQNILYGTIADSIGYISLHSFTSRYPEWWNELDPVLEKLQNGVALILDLRGNSGGNAFAKDQLIGRFFSERRHVVNVQTRRSARHDDFTDPVPDYVTNAGRTWEKPVILLTDRASMSASEWVTVALRELPNVTVVGDTTAGAFSGRQDSELPNGWLFSMSCQRITDVNGVCHEGIGLAPDVTIHVKNPGGRPLTDTILVSAIRLLQ